MNVYDLSRSWFNFCFENPDQIKPVHTAVYFFAIEHCNRLGWKEKFGLPSIMVMEAVGIKSYNTYINTLNDLVLFGFIKLIEKSKNQYSSNIIALSKFNKAHDKALDKALIKHVTKQSESTVQSTSESTSESIDSIDKQIYNYTSLPINNYTNLQDIANPFKVSYPFDSENFMMSWGGWRNYVIEIKKPYQTFSSEQAALQFLSEFTESDAIEIIKTAIKNQWKNLRKPDEQPDNKNQRKANLGRLNALTNTILQQPITFINDQGGTG